MNATHKRVEVMNKKVPVFETIIDWFHSSHAIGPQASAGLFL